MRTDDVVEDVGGCCAGSAMLVPLELDAGSMNYSFVAMASSSG
jgi:hypothetical protein